MNRVLSVAILSIGLLLARGAGAQPERIPHTDAGAIDVQALTPSEYCENKTGPDGKVTRYCSSNPPNPPPRVVQPPPHHTHLVIEDFAKRKKPVGAPTQATVDAQGGKVTSADGQFWIVFPPGALEQPTTISLQQFQIGRRRDWVEVAPANLPLKVPAKYVYRLATVDPQRKQVVLFHDPDHPDELVWMPGDEDPVAKTLTHEVTHL